MARTTEEHGEITCANQLLSKGFVQIPVIILQDKSLGAGAKLTYGLLLWYHWKGFGYPGHYAAAEEFGIGRASLCRYLVELEACGLVEKQQGFQGNFNTYHLPDPGLILGRSESQLEILGVSDCDAVNDQDSLVLDSVLIRTESEPAQKAISPKIQPASADSDSDFVTAIRETTTALDCPKDAKQLVTLAQAEGWPVDLILSAGRVVGEAISSGADIRKPGAYLTTAIRVMVVDRRQAAEVGKRKAGDRRQDALAYARQVYADPIIGGNWRQVDAILRESYGVDLAVEVVGELRGVSV